MTAIPIPEQCRSWHGRSKSAYYPIPLVDPPVVGPAPRWMKWIAITGVVIIGVTWLLAMSAMGLSLLK